MKPLPSDFETACREDRAGRILILRHAARNHTERQGGDGMLTPAGAQAAEHLGRILHSGPLSAVASPSARCMETALHLSVGYTRTHQDGPRRIQALDSLAVMHRSVEEDEGIRAKVRSMGLKRFLEEWSSDQIDGIDPLPEAAERLLAELQCVQSDNGGHGLVAVTHDFTVALLGRYLGANPRGHWPNYLEGLAVACDHGRWVVAPTNRWLP